MFVALRALLYAAGFVLFWLCLALLVRRYDARLSFPLPNPLRLLGALLAVAGAFVAVWSGATFVTTGRGTQAPFDPPQAFVVSGPYRYLRNPMYLGDFTVLLGAGLALPSAAVVLLALVFLFVAHVFVVLYEEPKLTTRFGTAYTDYWTTVPRWIPRLRPSSGRRGVA